MGHPGTGNPIPPRSVQLRRFSVTPLGDYGRCVVVLVAWLFWSVLARRHSGAAGDRRLIDANKSGESQTFSGERGLPPWPYTNETQSSSSAVSGKFNSARSCAVGAPAPFSRRTRACDSVVYIDEGSSGPATTQCGN